MTVEVKVIDGRSQELIDQFAVERGERLSVEQYLPPAQSYAYCPPEDSKGYYIPQGETRFLEVYRVDDKSEEEVEIPSDKQHEFTGPTQLILRSSHYDEIVILSHQKGKKLKKTSPLSTYAKEKELVAA